MITQWRGGWWVPVLVAGLLCGASAPARAGEPSHEDIQLRELAITTGTMIGIASAAASKRDEADVNWHLRRQELARSQGAGAKAVSHELHAQRAVTRAAAAKKLSLISLLGTGILILNSHPGAKAAVSENSVKRLAGELPAGAGEMQANQSAPSTVGASGARLQ